MVAISERRAREALAEYELALGRAPLASQSRRAYRSRVAAYLRWLTATDVADGDPLADPPARDRAVNAYRTWLQANLACKQATVNASLTALDHFYVHLRLGAVGATREGRPSASPRTLDDEEQRMFRHAVDRYASVRDKAIAYTLFYTGVRIAELVALDLPDVRVTAGVLLVRERGGVRAREIPLHAEHRPVVRGWIGERRDWPGAGDNAALFLNRRGGRLSARSVDAVVVQLGDAAGISGADAEERVTPHVLRHTFGARLMRSGAEVSRVAELMGHKRLETTRQYARSTR